MRHDTINRKDASVHVAGQTPSGHEEREREAVNLRHLHVNHVITSAHERD